MTKLKYIRKPNNYTIFKQYDSRWGYLPYPVLPSTMASSGCGCCAVTHCAIEQDKYMGYTPKNVQPFMKQYAEKGHGTYWSGITKGLEHYGLKDVKQTDSIAEVWKELAKGNRVGVFLFGNNHAPDGRIFTTGGHYIAVCGYAKDSKGNDWVYLKDSGGRNNEGWLCYQTSIRGTLKKMWVGKIDHQSIVLPERGYFKLGDKAQSVRVIQQFLKDLKLYKGKVGGKYWKLTQKAVRKFQKKYGLKVDGLWGKECTAMYEKLKKDK